MKEYIPLGEVIEKASVERCGERVFPILSITMKDGIVLQDEKFKKRIASVDTAEYKVIPRGKLVQGIHIDEANFGIQNLVDAGIVSPAYKVWDVCSEQIYPRFLEIAVRSPRSIAYYKSKLNGSVQRRGRMTDDDFLNMPIPFFDYERQKRIVDIIDAVRNLADQYEKEEKLLSEIVNARFVEMFVNKNYPREELDSLSLGKGEYGAQSASAEYDSNRPRYVRITDIKEDGTLNDDYVCSSNMEDDEAYRLSYGDFCFARMGATVGKTYAYKNGNQIFAGYLIRYKLNLNKIIPEYLYEFTRLEEYWNWVLLNQSGAAQPGINAKKYGSLKIPVAPLDEQRIFAEFVKQIDKSKFGYNKIELWKINETKKKRVSRWIAMSYLR